MEAQVSSVAYGVVAESWQGVEMIPTKTYPLSAIMGEEMTDKERIAELLQAAIVFKNYADDRYNKDPRSCAIINTPIQQRLWLAIDAAREGK